jgi:transposase-like protein/IS1 family transposase
MAEELARPQVAAGSPIDHERSFLPRPCEDPGLSLAENPVIPFAKHVVGPPLPSAEFLGQTGKRRRYQCRICGKTFCSNTGTPYHRLQHRRATFDEVATLSVEGMNKSAIARVKGIAWNTVHRWLERAAAWCRRFNDRTIKGLAVVELQADEIKTIVGSKEQPIWIFAVIEVWSRLWPSIVVGKRTYQNTLGLFRNVSTRMNLEQIPLVVTDGFGFYEKVVGRGFGPACLYGQVIKTRRDDRIVQVERRAVLGDGWRLEQALQDSEDSVKLNTSFVERLNLTIRQGSAYLGRRTICQARRKTT